MILVGAKKFMVREYEHIRRFLSRKDPNYRLGLRQGQHVYPSARNTQVPLGNI